MNEFLILGMIMAIPPWGMIFRSHTALGVQLGGLFVLILNLIVGV